MSYSFGFVGASKEEAKVELAAQYDRVVAGQKDHAQERAAAETCVRALIDVLHDSEVTARKSVHVSVNGSLSGKWENGGIVEVHAANLSAQVAYINR